MAQQFSEHLVSGITVTGQALNITQLSAKFQIKCREYGLDDSESLAVWIQGNRKKIGIYFGNQDYKTILQYGLKKLEGIKTIEV